MDYSKIYTLLQFSDTLKEALQGATFMRPQYYVNGNVVKCKFIVKDYLSIECINEFVSKMTDYLEAERFEPEFNVINKHLDASVLQQYVSDILKEDKEFNFIPVIVDDVIYLDLQDDQAYEKVVSCLKRYGVTNEIKREKFHFSDNDRQVTYSDENPYQMTSGDSTRSNSRRRKRFSREEDYLYMPMNKLGNTNRKVKLRGKVFIIEPSSFKSKKDGKTINIEKVTVSDFTDAIVLKLFESNKNTDENLNVTFYQGQILELYGTLKYDSFEEVNIFEPDKILELKEDPFVQTDNYPGLKHIELHAHTNRSEYDGVCETSEMVKTAYNLGQDAIAITDTSVVQAYPLAQQAHFALNGKNPDRDFKVIYGIDVKVVDEKLNIVNNPNDEKIYGNEFAVIDFETTGLSTHYDHIIEFGGVIVRNHTVTNETIQLFVKPPVPIPPFIQQKCNITDEMVADAEGIETAIDKILDFIGERVIVAHNADFDFNFLNDTLVRLGREPIHNVCLDTLNLAREVLKNRKYYRLGFIAKNYGVEYDEETAHRGDYDAQVLAEVLVRMIPDIPNYRNVTFKQLQENQDEDIYKKAHTYSMTLLAKNKKGIKKIYEIVTLSHTKYLTYYAKENAKKIDSEVAAEPRILKREIASRREDILVGSCDQYSELFELALNRSYEDMKKCMEFYDYIEIEPLQSYSNLVDSRTACNQERMKQVISDIIRAADELGKPIVASSNAYYGQPYEKIARDVYIMGKRIGGLHHPMYPMNKEKRKEFVAPDAHLMTTQELLDAFKWTGRNEEFVITNTHLIADSIEKIYPIPTELATPEIEGCEDILKDVVYENAHKKYGDPLPAIVSERIEKELTNIINNGFSVQYYIAYLLVKKSNEDGYPVGSRGSVGSSFIATMADITEVNPLVPHYVCPKCKHSEFFENNEYGNGFDLPPKKCPVCGEEMNRDGHNIPFETFLGFNGDKVPDIDLNFPPEYQGNAQAQIKEIFGEQYSYRAGTIGTVAKKTAYGYVRNYCEEKDIEYFSSAFMEVVSSMCEGVKRTTGQHPGGIVVIPKTTEIHDFTPIQYPANNPFSDWLTTHYAFADLHDNILKLDILAHIDPSAIRLCSLYSGVDYRDVPMSDKKTLSLFYSTEALGLSESEMYHEKNGCAGIPEFGTHNNRRILNETKPNSFEQLVNFEGLTHGTDVWANNAEVLIKNGTCTLSEVISCRDDIMSYLIAHDMDKKMSFDIMEKVRKGKGLKPEWIEAMKQHNVPDWYIHSCQLIKYMFPKAHAVAYAMNAVRMAWYKIYKPLAYYAVYFSIRCDAYDIETMISGQDAVYEKLRDIQTKMAEPDRRKRAKILSTKDEALEPVLEIALEMYLRGYHINNISLKKSEAIYFTLDPDDDKGIIPSFMSIDGLGESVANSIVEARNEHEFLSKEDLLKRTSVNGTQLAFMERLGVLDDLSEEDQLSLF